MDSIPQVEEVATKADLHRLEIKLVNLETRLTRLIFSSAAVVIVAVSAIVKLT